MDQSVFVMSLLGSLFWWTGESDVNTAGSFWFSLSSETRADTLASSSMQLPLCCIPTPNL